MARVPIRFFPQYMSSDWGVGKQTFSIFFEFYLFLLMFQAKKNNFQNFGSKYLAATRDWHVISWQRKGKRRTAEITTHTCPRALKPTPDMPRRPRSQQAKAQNAAQACEAYKQSTGCLGQQKVPWTNDDHGPWSSYFTSWLLCCCQGVCQNVIHN